MWFILLRSNNLYYTNNALHELSVVNLYLILATMKEAAMQVVKGHGAERDIEQLTVNGVALQVQKFRTQREERQLNNLEDTILGKNAGT
jgi:hypothetical protein